MGEELAQVLPDQYPDLEVNDGGFGLGAWIGTGVHFWMDHHLEIPGAIKEQKNFIYELEGYGTIKGSTDLFVDGEIVDYKILGKANMEKLRRLYLEKPNQIPTNTYRAQQHIYGYGWEQLGYEVKTVNILAIPKLSNDPRDIRWFTEIYNREIALAYLNRLEKIWKFVREDRLEELPSDDDCYVCTRVLFRHVPTGD